MNCKINTNGAVLKYVNTMNATKGIFFGSVVFSSIMFNNAESQ